MTQPLLILSDTPTGNSGLGRITRELALRIHAFMPDVFRVAVYGYGGGSQMTLPFPVYEMKMKDFTPTNLPPVWQHFARGEKGVILAIFNPSWVPWLANPAVVTDPVLRGFLESKPFERWIYAPIDGDINGHLPKSMGTCIYGFDRILAYTEYGKWVIEASKPARSPAKDVGVLPHGLDTSVFFPRDRKRARESLVHMVAGLEPNEIKDDVVMVGIVGTNTPRKDWPLGIETCAELVKRGVNVGLWIHTDALRKHYDIPMLVEEYGLKDRVISSARSLSDVEMAWAYSAMDCVLGIASGGGWEMVHSEAMGCGIPVLHGSYAGGAEFLPKEFLIEPAAYRGDGFFGIARPVFRASDWADTVEALLQDRPKVELPAYIDWNNAWKDGWERWLRGRKSPSDYSQPGDPYEIGKEYTAQSAAVDVRGNSAIRPRSIPTQAEADAIVEEAKHAGI